MSVGVSMRRSTASGRLPDRSRLERKLAAAAGPNTPDLQAAQSDRGRCQQAKVDCLLI